LNKAIEAKRGEMMVQVEAMGDIRIYSKHKHFVFKGGKTIGIAIAPKIDSS
jgi:hypothetical protein